MALSIKTSVKMIATLWVWCWISLKIQLCPEAFLCPKLGNSLFQIQGVSKLLWCIKLSYFAGNRWCPNINGVRKYMVNTVSPFALILVNSYSFFGQFVLIKFFFGQFVLIWSIRTHFGQFVLVLVNLFSH